MADIKQPVLELTGIHKEFPGVKALTGAGLRLFPGEVHTLMGQNGAGKSTLIKVLTGVYTPEQGCILLDGRPIAPRSTLEAQDLGISTVYQEVNLCPNLSVAENIFIGRYPRRFGAIQWRKMRMEAARMLRQLQVDIDVSQPLSHYPLAIQQMVAISRALNVQAKVLILDEPTSSLDEAEVQLLFSVLRTLRGQGMAILFVTHFLDQTYAISDRITVMRNGQLVGEYPCSGLSRLALVNKMIGAADHAAPLRGASTALAAANVAAEGDGGDSGHAAVQGVAQGPAQKPAGGPGHGAAHGSAQGPVLAFAHGPSHGPAQGAVNILETRNLGRHGALAATDLAIRKGEVLGLCGLLGSGRTELARLLFGADKADSGAITVDGRDSATVFANPREAIQAGIGFCSEDRKLEGAVLSLSVRENLILAMQARAGMWRAIPLKRQQELANDYVRWLGIKTASIETPIGTLSGGNQQKVLLARWLATRPKLMILDEPTRGIDIRAKEEIMDYVTSLCKDGMSVLFISSELPEVVRTSDRMVIMRDRKACGEYRRGELNDSTVLQAIAGETV